MNKSSTWIQKSPGSRISVAMTTEELVLGRQLGKSKVSPRSCTPGRRPILVSVSCTESDVVVAVSFKLTRIGYIVFSNYLAAEFPI